MTLTPIQSGSADDPMAESLRIDALMRTAHQHWTAGQAEQAERLCQGILRDWPGYADALHLLGVMAHTWGNHGAAIDYLRQACRAPRAPALYHSNLAEMLRQYGLKEEAEAEARQAIALDAELAQGWNNLGILCQEKGALAESVVALERALGLNKGFVEAYGNLGNTQKAMGDLWGARQNYEKALEMRPQQPVLHNNLAAVLFQLGEHEAALGHTRQAIEGNPRLIDAYLNAGRIELSRGRGDEALRWFNAVLSFAPDNTEALVAKVEALIPLENLTEAMAVSERAIGLKPTDAGVLRAHAAVLAARGEMTEALAVYDRALTEHPQNGAVLLDKARRFMEMGEAAEALRVLETSLAVDPEQPLAWYQRVHLKPLGRDEPAVERLQKLLHKPTQQGVESQIALHFALAKVFLEAGDGETAFQHLAEGNRRKRATLRYDAAEINRWMTSIINHHPADLFEAAGESGDPSEAPVVIVGLPGSGLTLVEHILAAHPHVTAAGALSTIPSLTRRIFNQQRQVQPYPSYLRALGPSQRTSLGGQYMSRLRAASPSAIRLLDNNPLNFFYAGMIHLIVPNARLIHVRRDPRDVGFSLYSKLFSDDYGFAYDMDDIAQFITASDELLRHWGAVLPENRWLDVDYELVVEDPLREARRLLAFLDLEWDEAMDTFWTNRRVIRSGSMVGVRKRPNLDHIGRWQPFADELEPLLRGLGA